MINDELLNPRSIVVVGASNDTGKPGGKVLKNIITNGYKGKLFVVNPNDALVQGIPSVPDCSFLPEVDLALIAVSAELVENIIQILALQKSCKAFIIFSSGFGEIGEGGKFLEQRCVQIIESTGGALIGPNCIGIITEFYKGVFAGPIPNFNPKGCECVSASGATMVFILEQALARGLTFSNIFTVGNSAQIGIEEILEYWDQTYEPNKSSAIKLLYMEEISNPQKFLKHARSLVNKGCRLAAIKAGSTTEGSRAVSSHTGSLAGSDMAVSALFRKAGIVRCYSRAELVYVAAIFTYKPLTGNRIAVITHAGGPGVMLTDILTKGGMQVPKLSGPKANKLAYHLFHGASVANPIDFLATGTAEQLGIILDFVDNEFDNIDASVVVFGTTGMWSVNNVYEVLHQKMNTCKKPIYPILPSVIQAADEVSHFQAYGRVNFRDEVSFGYVIARVFKTAKPYQVATLPDIDYATIQKIVQQNNNRYLSIEQTEKILKAAQIEMVNQRVANSLDMALKLACEIPFPLVMKVIGPNHKSDVGGVITDIKNMKEVHQTYLQLMQINQAQGVLLQPMIQGHEFFMGAKKEAGFGHLLLCGLGGIFVEVFKDISAGLSPLSEEECILMIQRLKSYPIIKGTRGKTGINEKLIVKALLNLSALLEAAPDIEEMDINPFIGNNEQLIAVDARIKLG